MVSYYVIAVTRDPIRIFVAYARTDGKLREEFAKILAAWQRDGTVVVWADSKLIGGEKWDETIRAKLEEADLFLFLVNRDALSSEYIDGVEMKRALARHHDGSARVVPVILRRCGWRSTELGTLQAIPHSGKDITGYRYNDHYWEDVRLGLKATLDELLAKKSLPKVRLNPKDGLTYVWIPAGGFYLGQWLKPEQTEAYYLAPLRWVTLTSGFWITQTPVTVRAFREFTTAKQRETALNPEFQQIENDAVVNVSWAEAVAFCTWAAGQLPTEAQWGYATGSGSIAWRNANLQRIESYLKGLAPAIRKPTKNKQGLHQTGNVLEWWADRFSENYDYGGNETDPLGPDDGDSRVVRGAFWGDGSGDVRAVCRDGVLPDDRFDYLGFRCVLKNSLKS